MTSVAQATSVGIDVSKSKLMILIGEGRPFPVSNDLAGIEKLISRLPEGSVVHLEASGGHERLVRDMLMASGFTVCRHNPRKVERMRDPLDFGAKTDPEDARLLCRAGGILKAPIGKSQEAERLCDLSRTIAKIKAFKTNLKKRMKTPQMDAFAVAEMQLIVEFFDARVESLEREAKARILASGRAKAYKAVRTAPGVGDCLARVLIAELPEDLRGFKTRRIARYGSVAPMDDSSGQRNGPKHIQPANMHIKAALYMPAISLIRSKPWAKELYSNLRLKGRSHEQAVVAVMRRLLVQAAAVIIRETPWVDEPPARPGPKPKRLP